MLLIFILIQTFIVLTFAFEPNLLTPFQANKLKL